MQDKQDMAELLTITEAAKKMHVSRETIYAWIRSGKVKPFRTPGGTYRIPEEQLIIPIEKPPVPSTGKAKGKKVRSGR